MRWVGNGRVRGLQTGYECLFRFIPLPPPAIHPLPPPSIHQPLQARELQEAARRRLEEEQRAAAEAEAAAWEATRHQREVAALLERSAELRELKQKLQAAEVNLERSQQRDQRAVIQAREREYEAAMQAAMAAARQEAAAREAAEAETRKKLEQEARQALDAQLQERAELQRVARVRGSGSAGCVCGCCQGMRVCGAGGRAAGRVTTSNCHLHCRLFTLTACLLFPLIGGVREGAGGSGRRGRSH